MAKKEKIEKKSKELVSVRKFNPARMVSSEHETDESGKLVHKQVETIHYDYKCIYSDRSSEVMTQKQFEQAFDAVKAIKLIEADGPTTENPVVEL